MTPFHIIHETILLGNKKVAHSGRLRAVRRESFSFTEKSRAAHARGPGLHENGRPQGAAAYSLFLEGLLRHVEEHRNADGNGGGDGRELGGKLLTRVGRV